MKINTKRTWAEINIDALEHNMKIIRSFTSSDAEIMAVVKADAYGHGVREISKTVLENGASWLAVSMLDEAVEIRNAGIKAPILILSDNEPECAEMIVDLDIRQGIYTFEAAKKLSLAAMKLNKTAKIHLKIDTGMGRVGFSSEDAPNIAERIAALPNIEIEGIFTHFAVADEYSLEADRYTKKQFDTFCNVCDIIEKEKNINIKIKHVCNSAGILRFPNMHLNMVRAGVILYGLWPSEKSKICGADFKAVMTLKSAVSYIKEVGAGTSLSYGCTYSTKSKTTIATIPVGYADGYMRALSNKGFVYHENSKEVLPIVGRICMDQMMVDAQNVIKEGGRIEEGDVIVLFGDYIDGMPTAEGIAKLCDTINYEIICAVSRRVPRIYKKMGKIIKISNKLTDK